MNACPEKPAGFTLVEMLVALLLASLLAIVVGTGLFLGVRSWEGLQRHQSETADAYVVQQALRRIVSGMRRETVRDVDGVRQVALLGNRDEVIFVAPLQRNQQREQLYWVWLGWLEETEDNETGLYLSYQSFTPFEENDPNTELGLSSGNLDWQQLRFQLLSEARPTLLFPGDFSGIEFEYLKVEDNSPESWEAEWVEESDLPALLSVRFHADALKQWPEMKIRPEVDAYVAKRLP